MMTGKPRPFQTLSASTQLRLPGTRRVVQERVSVYVPTFLDRKPTKSSGLGPFRIPRPHLSSLKQPTPSLHRHLRARPRAGARLPCPPLEGCQSQLFAVPWLPKQRSLGASATPLWNSLPPFVVFAQSQASECSLVPASPPPPARNPPSLSGAAESPDLQACPGRKAGRGVCVKGRGARRKWRGMPGVGRGESLSVGSRERGRKPVGARGL